MKLGRLHNFFFVTFPKSKCYAPAKQGSLTKDIAPRSLFASMSWYITLTGQPPSARLHHIINILYTMFSFFYVWQPVTGLHSVLHLSYLSIFVKLSKLTSRTGWFVDDMYCNLKSTIEAHWCMCWYITWDRVTTGGPLQMITPTLPSTLFHSLL